MVVAGLKHPSILELYAFFEDENCVYLVLELARHGELQRFLRNLGRTMSETEAAGVMKQVVAGLLYLHSHRIIHRDLSLSNLLLMDDRHVKIADFGLAIQLVAPDERHTNRMSINGKMSLGERIEDYRILEPLGKGGFAQVYKALCLTTGIFVAIKMVRLFEEE
uniref:Protein kinase domain-containing protein n=1 Tax=Phlebotomus papatasi TaxID=29031 RepID=A0A1B0D9N0_PHLPP